MPSGLRLNSAKSLFPDVQILRCTQNDIGVTQLNTISQAEDHRVPVQNYPQLRKSYDSFTDRDFAKSPCLSGPDDQLAFGMAASVDGEHRPQHQSGGDQAGPDSQGS